MCRQLIHHAASALFVLPVLGISIWGAVQEPELLNPWNNTFLSELWILILPALVCSSLIMANALFGFRAAWRAIRPGAAGRCLACGYDLTGNVSGTCPECGTAIPARSSSLAADTSLHKKVAL